MASTPFISFQIQGKSFSFSTPSKFKDWIDVEWQLWEKISVQQPQNYGLQTTASFVNRVDQARQLATQLLAKPDDAQSLERLIQVCSRLRFQSASAEAKVIKRALEANSTAGLVATALFMGDENARRYFQYDYMPAAFDGILEYYCFQRGVSPVSSKANEEALSQISEAFHAQVEEAKAQNAQANEQNAAQVEAWQKQFKLSDDTFATLVAEIKASVESAKTAQVEFAGKSESQLEAQINESKNRVDSLFTDTEKRQKELHEKYDEFLKLKAPVKYWGERARVHRRNAVVFGLVFVALLSALGTGMWQAVTHVFEHFPTSSKTDQSVVSKAPSAGAAVVPTSADPSANTTIPATSTPTIAVSPALDTASTSSLIDHVPLLSRVSLLLLLSALGIWLTRIVARLFMSNMHMVTECEERATMILTYLALHSEKAVTEQERILVLTNIFRPSTTGIVTDDAAPPTVFDLLKTSAKKD